MRLSTLAQERASATGSVSELSTEEPITRPAVLSFHRNLLDHTERTPGLREPAMPAEGSRGDRALQFRRINPSVDAELDARRTNHIAAGELRLASSAQRGARVAGRHRDSLSSLTLRTMPIDIAEPYSWIIAIAAGLLGLLINLLLIYMVIRLAITHGMLSYSRQLADDRRLPVHRD